MEHSFESSKLCLKFGFLFVEAIIFGHFRRFRVECAAQICVDEIRFPSNTYLQNWSTKINNVGVFVRTLHSRPGKVVGGSSDRALLLGRARTALLDPDIAEESWLHRSARTSLRRGRWGCIDAEEAQGRLPKESGQRSGARTSQEGLFWRSGDTEYNFKEGKGSTQKLCTLLDLCPKESDARVVRVAQWIVLRYSRRVL